MKLFLAAFLCSTFPDVKALGCETELWPCSLVADIATITCAGGDVVCASDDYTMDPAVKSIDADSCRELCIKQKAEAELAGAGDPACAFYRWENEGAGKCSLQTVCGEVDVTCDPPECVTGEIGCSENGEDECKLSKATTWNHEKFHWICHGSKDVNIYAESQIEGIPDGTFCQTTHKCADWADQTDDTARYWRKLGIFCDKGEWKALDSSGDDRDKTGNAEQSGLSIKGDTGSQNIEEPECPTKCDILELTHIKEDGTEIFCDEALNGDDTLIDGNSCILICDNHWSMSISCEFAIDGEGLDGAKHDGEKQWQDQTGKQVGDDDVKCG